METQRLPGSRAGGGVGNHAAPRAGRSVPDRAQLGEVGSCPRAAKGRNHPQESWAGSFRTRGRAGFSGSPALSWSRAALPSSADAAAAPCSRVRSTG